jgi:hypothetical protein
MDLKIILRNEPNVSSDKKEALNNNQLIESEVQQTILPEVQQSAIPRVLQVKLFVTN